MSPILKGVVASQITGHLVTSSYDSIQTVTVGAGGASSISFTSIPSTYKHLQIRAIGRTTDSGVVDSTTAWRFNSDSGANYTLHLLIGDGTSASAYAGTGRDNASTYLAGAGASANVFGAMVMDVLDYTNTNKYKTIRSLFGTDTNGSGGRVMLDSNLWLNTAAITSISATPVTGTFTQYSSFALYGIKG
jgi:hypothetical protein